MRKASFPCMAGNPPAAAFQASGMKGMIVMVITKVTHEPRAPRIPNFLFQKPNNKSAPNNHSEAPKNQLAPWMPKTGYIQEIRGPLLIKGINPSASYANHFWYPKKKYMITIDARTTW